MKRAWVIYSEGRMRSTWRGHGIYIKIAWDLNEELMISKWRDHGIYMKRL